MKGSATALAVNKTAKKTIHQNRKDWAMGGKKLNVFTTPAPGRREIWHNSKEVRKKGNKRM